MKFIPKLAWVSAIAAVAATGLSACAVVPYEPPGYYYGYSAPAYGPPVYVAPPPVIEFSYSRTYRR